jgi:hypothetical protein
VLVKGVAATARKRLQVHRPGCSETSFDEIAVLGVVAAAQEALREANDTILKMRLRFLVDGPPDPTTLFAAQAVAQILAAGHHRLPLRLHADLGGMADRQTPALRVIH